MEERENMTNNGQTPPPYQNQNMRQYEKGGQSLQYVGPRASADRLRFVGIPLLIYAIICAVCMYSNWSSILSAFFSLVSVFFITFCLVRYEKHDASCRGEEINTGNALAKQSPLIPWFVLMIMLSIAVCMTGDSYLIVLCNIGTFVCEMYAVACYFNDTKEWGIFIGIFELLEFICCPVAYIHMPFVDRKADRMRSGRTRSRKVSNVLIGLVIVLPILIVVLKLLSVADPVFKKVVNDIFGKIFFSWDIVKIVLFAFAVFLFVYGVAVEATMKNLNMSKRERKQYDPAIGCTICMVLTAFYLIFVAVQIIYLFMNSGSLPDGVTYAKYARTGFFELLFVAVLNVCIVTICDLKFRSSVVLKTVLVIMSICTYVMIASAAMRMIMYISEYDLTYLRLNTLWALAATAVVLAGVVVKMFCRRMPLFSYVLMTVMVLLAVYAFVRPNAMIAEYNLGKTHSSKEIDMSYVMETGNDGVPYVVDYLIDNDISPDTEMEELCTDAKLKRKIRNKTVGEILGELRDENDEKGYVRSFNFSRFRASDAIDKYLIN